jgi:hypothetical protein
VRELAPLRAPPGQLAWRNAYLRNAKQEAKQDFLGHHDKDQHHESERRQRMVRCANLANALNGDPDGRRQQGRRDHQRGGWLHLAIAVRILFIRRLSSNSEATRDHQLERSIRKFSDF